MNKEMVVDFIRRHRRGILACLCLMLLLSVIMLSSIEVTRNATEIMTVDKATFETLPYYNYTVTVDEATGKKTYVPDKFDPQVHMGFSGQRVNTVRIFFADEIDSFAVFQMYYVGEGVPLSEANSRFGSLSVDRRSCVVLIPDVNLTLARFDIDATFSIDRIELSYDELSPVTHSFRWQGLVLLLVTVLIASALVIFEKKLGFVQYLREAIKGELDLLLSMIREKKFLMLASRCLSRLTAAVFAITYTVYLTASSFTYSSAKTVFILGIISAVFAIFDIAISRRKNAARVFVVIALLLGLTLSFIQAPSIGGAWDEQIHYERVVNLKCALFNPERTLADNSLSNISYTFSSYYANTDWYISTVLSEDSVKIAPNEHTLTYYYTVGYLPAALAMGVCEAFGADILKTIVISRIANLLTYAFVLYLGMRKLKSGALIFASVALMPTAIFLATTFSYDFWVSGFIGCSVAYMISVLQDAEHKISIKDLVIIFATFFIGCGPKTAYFLLLAPFLFISRDKFKDKRWHLVAKLAAIAVMLAIVFVIVLPFFADVGGATDGRGGSDVDSSGQIKYMLADPMRYISMLINFLLGFVAFGNASAYTTAFGYFGFTSNIYGTLALVIMLMCAFVDKSEADDFKGALLLKASSWVTVLGQLAIVATALYISFTPVGHPTVLGCQYRYIIPTLFIGLYSIGSGKISNKMDKGFMNALVFALLAFNAFMTYYQTIITRII